MNWQEILNQANQARQQSEATAASVRQTVEQSNQNLQNLLGSQKAEQQGAFDLYKQTVQNQEQLPVLYQRLNTELGIPDLSSTVQGYKNQITKVQQLLGNLDADLASRTKGTMTTEAQRNRLIAAEGSPLRSELSNLGYAMAPSAELLSGAQGTLGTLLNLNVQQQEKELKPLELQISSISDRFSREITGFTTQRQGTLDVLMDKLNRERTLSDREWELAQDLAAEEREYARQKAQSATNLSQYLGNQTTTPSATSSRTANDWSNLLQGSSNISLAIQPSSNIGLGSARAGAFLNKSGGSSIPLGTSSGGFKLQGSGLRLQ
jgi:hypothetical protein